MEYCSGGEVFEMCMKEGKSVEEPSAKRIFRDVVEAIAYCHNQKICHRDLKPENLLFLNN
jgi:serine/threonine protein kinase